MIHLKNQSELDAMRRAGIILATVFDKLSTIVEIGISADRLDAFIYDSIRAFEAEPSFLGYSGYKYSSCISKNEEVVHGLPTSDKFLLPGDIVSIDIGVYYKGFHADACRIFIMEELDPSVKKLAQVTEDSFYEAIKDIGPGCRMGDVGHALQTYVEAHELSVVRDLYSHGIGKKLHEDPLIPNFAKPGSGILLKEGLTFALEPMVNIGDYAVETLADEWTIVTCDGLYSAHYENTVAVTEKGIEILTILN